MTIKNINQALGAAGIVGIMLMVVVTTADVAGRYLANSPILGTVEFTRTVMVFAACLPLAFVQFKKQHIRTEVILSRLPPKSRTVVEGLESLLALVVIGAICYSSLGVAYYSVMLGEFETGIINFPMWPGRIGLALGLLALSIQYGVDAIDSFRLLLRRGQT